MLKDHFSFSRSERNGIIILLSLILILIVTYNLMYVFEDDESSDFSQFEKETGEYERGLMTNRQQVMKVNTEKKYSGKRKKTRKKDIGSKNIYKQENIIIEINSSDTSELKKLKGIGSVYSKRIVKYRDLLGGFYKKEQLMDVYGIDNELYSRIEKSITIDTALIRKIRIDTASFSDLLRHPYLDIEDVKAIVNARDSADSPHAPAGLILQDILPDKKYQKIKYYLEKNYQPVN